MVPWQIGRRDIDPSTVFGFPVGRERESAGTGSAWWAPTTYDDWNPELSTPDWIMDCNDLPHLGAGLVVRHPESQNASWICCYSFQLFQEPYPPDQNRYDVERREVWFRTMAFLVPKGAYGGFAGWVMSGEFRKSNWHLSVPQLNGSGIFLGEHCWSPASDQQGEGRGERPLEWRFPPESDLCTAQVPVATHSTSGNGYDCSVGFDVIEVHLPGRAIVKGC